MKICNFEYQNKKLRGVLKDNLIYPSNDLSDVKFSDTCDNSTKPLNKSDVKFLPPVFPSKIVGVGRNYAAHAAELGNEVPKEPMLFLKAPSTIIISGEPIILPAHSSQVEFEGELGVVIGRDCKNLA